MSARIETLARAAVKLRLVEASLELLQRWQSPSSAWLLDDGPASLAADHALEAFESYLSYCDGQSRLLILGTTAAPGAVSARAEEEFAGHTEQVDRINAAARKAAFLSVDALLLTGNQETALEAMAIGTPVVGEASRAALDLVGSAGLLWNEEPLLAELLAVSIRRVREDATLRATLRERGFEIVERHAFVQSGAR